MGQAPTRPARPPLPPPTPPPRPKTASSANAAAQALAPLVADPSRASSAGNLVIEPGTIVASKYQLERPLSSGAMGSVWVATHLGLETHVAIKFMASLATETPVEATPTSQSTSSRKRFEHEAKAAAQIRSANVVQILDYGVDQGTPYIVMELLVGEDLGERLKRVRRLSLAETAHLVTAVARALHRAHDAKLVHRDLKPGNIFLAKEGDEEVAKVLDFGVSKAVRDRPIGEGTLEGTLVGTPSYMSPEQAMGRPDVDHRADLWSLGVIAYRALTGAKPFAASKLLEVVVQICSQTPTRPSELVPGLAPEVDAFFEKALQRDVRLRFQSAKEMARAFAAIAPRLGSEPPPEPGVTTWRPPVKVQGQGHVDGNSADDISSSGSNRPSAVSASHLRSTFSGGRVPLSEIPSPTASAAEAPRQSVSGFVPALSADAPDEVTVAQASPPLAGSRPGSVGSLAGAASPLRAEYAMQSERGVVSDLELELPPFRSKKKRAVVVVALGTGLLGLAVAVAAVSGSSPPHPTAAGASATASKVEPASTASAATPPLPAPSAAPAPTSDSSPALSASAAPGKRAATPTPRWSPPPKAEPKPDSDCDQPYTWDKDGTKHIKPKCL